MLVEFFLEDVQLGPLPGGGLTDVGDSLVALVLLLGVAGDMALDRFRELRRSPNSFFPKRLDLLLGDPDIGMVHLGRGTVAAAQGLTMGANLVEMLSLACFGVVDDSSNLLLGIEQLVVELNQPLRGVVKGLAASRGRDFSAIDNVVKSRQAGGERGAF